VTENSPGAQEVLPGSTGSLERGLAGDYPLSIGEVISEAWERKNGNKGTVWAAMLMYFAALFVLSLVLRLVFGAPPIPPEGVAASTSPVQLIEQLLNILLVTPIWVGIIFLGVAIASDRPAKPVSIFSWYGRTVKLFITYILMVIMVMLGMLLLVLPGVYLAVAYQMALPLVADKDMGPWEALETSRKALTHKWFTFFGLLVIVVLASSVSMVLLGIPLIWILPAAVVGHGIVYRNIFGAEESSLLRAGGG
jgi:uncharacterized membrane protein